MANMTQKELADAIGVSQTYISDAESNRTEISVGLLEKIADFYELRLEVKFIKK